MKELIKRQLAFIVMIAMLVSMLPTSMLQTAVARAEDGEAGEEPVIILESDPVQPGEGGGPIKRGPMGPQGGNLYVVTFYSKDATGEYVKYEEQEVLEGQKPTLPANPLDTYAQVFDSWDSNATAVVTGDMDVYAKYRDRKTLIYAVEFYMQDGIAAGVNTVYTVELEGKNISRTIPVPELPGYTPFASHVVDPSETAVPGFTLEKVGSDYQVVVNDTNISADKTFRVVYVPNGNTPYTVRHWQQTVTGGATHNGTNFTEVTADVDSMQGPTGSNVAPVAKSYTGFTLDTDIPNMKVSIKADGSTVVDLYYVRNEYSVYFDLGGGTLPVTQPNPMVVRYGAPLNVNTITPSRLGYDNAATKWLPVQPTGAIPTVMPASDVIVKANWTPKTNTPYTVVVWAQNANDDNDTQIGSFQATGTTEGVATTTDATVRSKVTSTLWSRLENFRLETGTKTIKGDGTTILNVYYTRKIYTLSFYLYANGTTTPYVTTPSFTITGRYMEDLTEKWNSTVPDKNKKNGFKVASPTASSYTNFIPFMEDSLSYYERDLDSGTESVLWYMFEVPAGDTPTGTVETLNGVTYQLHHTETHMMGSSYSFNEEEFYEIPGTTRFSPASSGTNNQGKPEYSIKPTPDPSNPKKNLNKLYYKLVPYPLTFIDRGQLETIQVPYTKKLAGYATKVPTNAGPAGYTFGGWYAAEDGSGTAFNFANATMPYNALNLYAKWVPPTFTVTFNAAPGAPNPATQQVVWGGKITTPSPVPTYFQHELAGWYYEQDGKQVRFLENQEIYRNYDLKALWTGDDTVKVTVKYLRASDGTPLMADENVQGQLGETLTIPAKGFPDYMPNVPYQELKLTQITGHTVTFTYEAARTVTYRVKYLDKATNQPLKPEKTVTYTHVPGDTPQATETRVVIPGYTADAYQKSILLALDPAFNEIVFFYTKQDNDTSYKVVHHFENANTGGYTSETGASIPAYAGQVVTATQQTRTGFTYEASLSNASGTVLADGSLTLNLYYKRTRHSYVVNYVSLQTGILDSVTRSQIKYGATVTETRADIEGNVYVGFVVGAQSGAATSASATITDDTTVFTFNYNTMYDITATAVNGTINPASASVEHGKSATFTYSPTLYYELDKVLVDGVVVAPSGTGSYTFTNVKADHTLEVQFKKKQFQLTVSAVQQKYVYNALAQGYFGTTTDTKYVTVTGLQPGHTVTGVTLTGTQRTNAGTYENEIKPTTVTIEDAQGNDASGFYVITRNNANLVIDKKGDGEDPKTGEQIPIKVTAASQTYVYNGQLQGEVGLQNISVGNPLASATGLLSGHTLTQVTINGNQKRDVGTYTGELKPTLAVIMAGGTPVTDNYLIEASSYIPGTLQITKFGDGTATITAKKQEFVYNGGAQGHFGANLPVTAGDIYVEANGLLQGHELRTITLTDVSTSAQNLTDVDTYAGVVKPGDAVIVDTNNGDADVTDNYDLTYKNGDIVITPKGHDGGPLEITATLQVYTYNGLVQGDFRTNLTINQAKPEATALGLVEGHKLQIITLSRNPAQQPAIDATTYAGHIVPSVAQIVDGSGNNVTSNYWITDASYKNGDLRINPKGNGKVDPTDPDGREYPLDVTAVQQTYIYNGQPQGDIGEKTTKAASEAVLTPDTLLQLVNGEYISGVTINTLNNGGQKREPDTYAGYLIPAAVQISNGAKNVTSNYRIEPATSYHAGTLLIKKKGSNTDNDKPITITARDQVFVYNHQPQGHVGTNLSNQAAVYGTELVSSLDLATGHYIKLVDINVPQKTDAGTYSGYLTPTVAKIFAMENNAEVEVTSFYLIDDSTSYKAGTLKIDADPNAGVKVIARDQTYTYNGTPQGVVGAQNIAYQTQAGRDAAYVYATGLYDGHYLSYAAIGQTQQTNAGTYALPPSGAKIVDINGNDVGSNYDLTKIEYVSGELLIHPKGNGTPDPEGGEYPLDIYAVQQEDIYNGTARGDFGPKTAAAGSDRLTATGLVAGQVLTATLSADGAQAPAINAATYPAYIIPGGAKIMSGATDVTANYRIDDSRSYHKADLIIHPKGNGTPDPEGGEYPLEIHARKQSYVYDATPQGDIGIKTAASGIPADQAAIAAVIEKTVTLVPGHYISSINILTKNNEGKKKDPDTYTEYLIPDGVLIRDAAGSDVTSNYRLEGAKTYFPADLFIDKRGTGPDNSKPITITAVDQTYVYSGQPQGVVGKGIDVATEQYNGGSVVVPGAGHLAQGHVIKTIDIDVEKKTNVGLYTGYLAPAKVVIIDTLDGDRVVTDFYKIDDVASYVKGTLEITKQGEGTLRVKAQTQTYTYDGTAQGKFDTFENQTPAQMDVYAVATGLNQGHRLADITLSDVSSPAQNLIDAGNYDKVIRPSAMKIVDDSGADVTSNYFIDGNTYIDGDLIIKPRGVGPDLDQPITISAVEQRYIYDDTPQGEVGANLAIVTNGRTLVTTGDLLQGDELRRIDMGGSKKILPDIYEDELKPNNVVIWNAARNVEVTGNYVITPASYRPADLVIEKKGKDGDNDKPITVTAREQQYVYDNTPKGLFGANLAVPAVNPIVLVPDLVPGHYAYTVTLSGTQMVAPGQYLNAITPSALVIRKGNPASPQATDEVMTDYYKLTTESYIPGNLLITPKDGADLTVTALDQEFIYDGNVKGWDGTRTTDAAAVVKVDGLYSGHYVASVDITVANGVDRVNPGVNPGALSASALVIRNSNAGDADVTSYYNLNGATYIKGKLTIHKKGNGDPDPDDGEKPLTITAGDQSFVYNAQAQGYVGGPLPVDDPAYSVILAEVQKGLLPGHKLKSITLAISNPPSNTAVNVGDYTLVPTAAVIVDGTDTDVTSKYNIKPESYVNGEVHITPKAVTVTALKQTYTYNNSPQGVVGALERGVTTGFDSYVKIEGVADATHVLQTVTMGGSKQTVPGIYVLSPSAAIVWDASSKTVTTNYTFNYVDGELEIKKKGNGNDPILVEALPQTYTYKDQPQGKVGTMPTPADVATVVKVTGLLPGQTAYQVSIPVAQQTDAGTYMDYLKPARIKIMDDATSADVTAYYDIDEYTDAELDAGNLQPNRTYKHATLLINKKGNGIPDPDGKEYPFEVTAKRQAYVYNGLPQGEVGTLNTAAKIAAYIDTDTLIPGHTIRQVDISDATAQRTNPNLDGAGNAIDYVDLLVPKAIQIFNTAGDNVTKNYEITYNKGNLFIDKKGSGGNNGDYIVVTAIDQLYSYDGLAHGIVGGIADVALPQYLYQNQTVVNSAHLAGGDRIKAITINAIQQTAANVYTDVLKPSGVSIVNTVGVDVTRFYKIDPEANLALNQTYVPGTLTIERSRKTVTITLHNQSYVYNGTAQGVVGSLTVPTGVNPYVTATGLESGERLAWVDINQVQQTVPGSYALTIQPSSNTGTKYVKIINGSGADVTGNYDVENFVLVPATLTISQRPLTITVTPQTYTYNASQQGIAGGTFNVITGLPAPDPAVLATAQADNGAGAGMIAGQTFSTITLGGSKQTNAGAYQMPATGVVILASSVPVQDCYDITYVNATLTIKPIGIGPSGDDPISISAIPQAFEYNALPQGWFGTFTDPKTNGNLAQVDGTVLLSGHRLANITLSGAQETNVGTYTDRIVPTAAVIRDSSNNDVTANYVINAASYKKADLLIQPVATPVQLVATRQVYTYNAQPQGVVGAITIAASDTAPLVTTAQPLLQGHRLSQVYLEGNQQTNAGTYSGELVPRTAGAIILDSKGNNVTGNYTFVTTHVPADLVIKEKGNGTPDPTDPDGGEYPMDVWALKQNYVYNAQLQGKFGTLAYDEALARIIGVLPGHKVTTVTLAGSQKILPALYPNEITPNSIVITDAVGNDVTANYLLTAASYKQADLEIHKKGDGTPDGNGGENPLRIYTPDQVFVYDAQPHGTFGVNLPVGANGTLATAVQLVPGHEIEYITLRGAQQTNAGTYADAISPWDIKIIDSTTHNDETPYYNINLQTSYIPADLVIRPRGIDGDPDNPMKVQFQDETYTYNGQLQGSYGEIAIPATGPAKATLYSGATGLVPGHTFTAVFLADRRQMHAGVYPNALMPIGVRIQDSTGADVTANYFFNASSYLGGTLTINKLGRIDNDGNLVPILIVAEDQTYYYNGRPQGYIGRDIRAQQRMDLVYTVGLLEGDYVYEIDISGKRQVAVGEYPDTFMPSNAMLLNAFGENVTGDYMITDANTYFAGALIILEAEDVLGVFDLENEYFGITSRDIGDLVE